MSRKIKPRAQEVHRHGFSPTPSRIYPIEGINISAWCPDRLALESPEQVHLTFETMEHAFPFVLRFKSPDTIGFLIEELIEYRRLVWPSCEPISGEENHDSD